MNKLQGDKEILNDSFLYLIMLLRLNEAIARAAVHDGTDIKCPRSGRGLKQPGISTSKIKTQQGLERPSTGLHIHG